MKTPRSRTHPPASTSTVLLTEQERNEAGPVPPERSEGVLTLSASGAEGRGEVVPSTLHASTLHPTFTPPATEPATCNVQTATALSHAQSTVPPTGADSAIPHSEIRTPHLGARRRTGNVARLSKEIRQRVNEMLDDGLPYETIIENLGEHGKGITRRCVGNWKAGGYQDYLRELRIVDQCRYRQGLAFSFAAKRNPINGFLATQQIAAAQICEAVAVLGPDILREALAANPLNYFRMLNSFARLTNGGLKCDRHLAEQAERGANTKSPRKKGLSAAALKEMTEKLNLM